MDAAAYHVWAKQESGTFLSDEIWKPSRGSLILQPSPDNVLGYPPIMPPCQMADGRLSIPRRGSEIRIELGSGTISCLQWIPLGGEEDTNEDAWSAMYVVSVIDAKARESRVYAIPAYARPEDLTKERRLLLRQRGAAFSGFTFDFRRSRLYVLDAARFVIWRIDDTNDDGVPDLVSRGSVVAPEVYRVRKGMAAPLSIAWLERPGLRGVVPSSLDKDGQLAYPRRGNGLQTPRRGRFVDRVFWADMDDDGFLETRTVWSDDDSSSR